MSNDASPTGQPEYLHQGSGAPLRGGSGGGSRRRPLIVGAAVAGLALVGGGVWATVSFFSTGAQPAEALPVATLGYASVDLDPSGGQKIAALTMLRKFPAFRDQIGLDTDDDIKATLFDELGLADTCEDVTYVDDIEPWLGDRAAMAAIDLGEESPTAAAVLQVSDPAAAEAGLTKLRDCGGGGDVGWSIDGDWAVLAETTSIAEQIAGEADQGSLADDDDYQRWTDEVGDSGVVNLYAAPAAGAYLAEGLDGFFGLGTQLGYSSSSSSCSMDPMGVEVCYDDNTGGQLGDVTVTDEFGGEMPTALTDALEDFAGLAITLRFDDGGLELEMAGDAGVVRTGLPDSDNGDDVLSTLPDDTAVAVGVGFVDGWVGGILERVAELGGQSVEELIAQAEEETGLVLPDDVETLLGEAAAFAVGSDLDPEAAINSTDLSGIPVGVKVRGDAAAIEEVLDKLRATIPADELELISEANGDLVAIGANPDYVATLAEDGSLGDLDVFRDVVRDSGDAAAILFVNFDAGDGWLDGLAGGSGEVDENLAPLQAFGISSWRDGDVAHAVVRLTTD